MSTKMAPGAVDVISDAASSVVQWEMVCGCPRGRGKWPVVRREVRYDQVRKLELRERIRQPKLSDNRKSARLRQQRKVSDNGKVDVSTTGEFWHPPNP